MPSDIAQTEQIVTEVNERRLPGKSTYNFVEMTTVKWYLSSYGSSLILLKLSETHKLPRFDSGFVNNTAMSWAHSILR